MKKIILTAAFFVGIMALSSAQNTQEHPTNEPKKHVSPSRIETDKPTQVKRAKVVDKQELQQKKEINQEQRNATNDALMRSEQKSSEKLRKEVIK